MLDAESITPDAPADLAARARDAADGPLVVLASVPSFGRRRLKHVGIVAAGSKRELLVSGFVPRPDLGALVEACGEGTVKGAWDAAFAAGWEVAWAELDGLRSWTPTDEIVHATADSLTVRGQAIDLAEVDHVEVFASSDRVRRGLRVARFEDSPVDVMVHSVPVAGETIHLDHMDLKQELLWAQALGRTLARAISRPYFDTV